MQHKAKAAERNPILFIQNEQKLQTDVLGSNENQSWVDTIHFLFFSTIDFCLLISVQETGLIHFPSRMINILQRHINPVIDKQC